MLWDTVGHIAHLSEFPKYTTVHFSQLWTYAMTMLAIWSDCLQIKFGDETLGSVHRICNSVLVLAFALSSSLMTLFLSQR